MDFNRARLTLARRRRGLSQRELAVLIGCDERTVRKWELGERVPAPAQMDALVAKLLFRPTFYTRSESPSLPADAVSFRALSKTKASDRDRALAAGELALDLDRWITERFDLPRAAVPNFRDYRKKPEEAAMSLRVQWGLGDKPIRNMVDLLEVKGVRVFSLAEDCHDLDAFSFWQGERPFVLLNTLKSAERSRFDAAHELGHLVLHRHGPPAGREPEREADAFASAFLMPRSSINTYAPRVPTIPALIQAKQYPNVSVAALAHRLHDVGKLTDWQYRHLCIEIQRLGIRKAEPKSGDREKSQVLEKVFSAMRSEGLGQREIAEMLGWPLRELNALVFGLILSVQDGAPAKAATPPAGRDVLRLVK